MTHKDVILSEAKNLVFQLEWTKSNEKRDPSSLIPEKSWTVRQDRLTGIAKSAPQDDVIFAPSERMLVV
jgi:hypothetical protein